MNIETGGTAFPRPHQASGGMTLRDYFAAKAMQGFLAASGKSGIGFGFNYPENNINYAGVAYIIADAMLAERAK